MSSPYPPGHVFRRNEYPRSIRGIGRVLLDVPLVWEPTVTLLAKPSIPPDDLMEMAARISHASVSRGPEAQERLLRLIAGRGEGGIWEHVSYTWLIAGIDRLTATSLVRHRVGWSYVQESSRYVELGKAACVVPLKLGADPSAAAEGWVRELHWQHKESLDRYEEARRELPNEIARRFLPPTAETRLVATANVRALVTLLHQRGSVKASPEMRVLAYRLWESVVGESRVGPLTSVVWAGPHMEVDGAPIFDAGEPVLPRILSCPSPAPIMRDP